MSAPERIALDFRTDMTRASAPVLRLGVIVSVPSGWDYAWKRDRLEPDEVALCNLATWPELGVPLAPFLQRVIEEFADDVYGSFGKWSLYSAFQLVDLSSTPQSDRESLRDEPLASPSREEGLREKVKEADTLLSKLWRALDDWGVWGKDDRTIIEAGEFNVGAMDRRPLCIGNLADLKRARSALRHAGGGE